MRTLSLQAATALALLMLGMPATAGAPPVQDWTGEVVVVTARKPGPLFWKVRRGAGEVDILAVVGPLPEDLKWDHSGLETVLDGARTVLLQPHAEVGVLEGAWFLLTERSSLELPDDTHLENILDPALRDRFVRAREKLHHDGSRYEDYKPAWAGFRLFSDFLDAEALEPREPGRMIERLAGRKEVSTHPIATYEALPVIRDIGRMSDAESRACLKSALDDIETEGSHQRAAAEAWAVGDLEGMKANYSEATMFACLQAVPKFATLWKQSVEDTTRAADAALASGGRSVLVASLGTLLRKDGILDRLRAQGASVEDPH